MPALELAQETGTVLRWLKGDGESAAKGEPIVEIETDKVTVEIEAPASGILRGVTAREGDIVPVGQTIAWILSPGEPMPTETAPSQSGRTVASKPLPAAHASPQSGHLGAPGAVPAPAATQPISATPVALQMAKEHGVDLALVKPGGGRIDKSDVLAYIQTHPQTRLPSSPFPDSPPSLKAKEIRRTGRTPVSPKARRLALERNIEIPSLRGSGPDGAVLAADVLDLSRLQATPQPDAATAAVSPVWRLMAERMSQSWTTVPHFYLMREIGASALIEMRERITPAVQARSGIRPTYTDLLVKLVAIVLRDHPHVNASWVDGRIRWNDAINIGLATAIEDGLIVPVIHSADALGISELAAGRRDLVERTRSGKLRPADIAGGTFTLTNLGMYNVDVFNAIINAPQAAILAVGRIADCVVPVNAQPAVRPMMVVTLSCDHRVVDGARGARFLDDLARLIQEPRGVVA